MSIIHPQVRGGRKAEWKGGDMGVPVTACLASWAAAAGLGFALKESPSLPYVVAAGGVLGFYLLFAIKVARQWEKAVVLRMGRFVGLRGSGVFLIVPVFESVREMVDQRVRVTSVSAESALTRDTVPVNVDAIVFWLVWDAEKVIFEVQEYFDAVTLSAQTALRESIGRHMLAEMITDRETLGKQLQKILDEKTNGWGVTVQSVEIRDVRLPAGLEDAMSRQAQAERERQARVILGTAETEIAQKFAEASLAYRDNPAALQLRAMNMLYEAMKERGSMVIIPSSVVETMGGAGSLALASLGGARPGEPTPVGAGLAPPRSPVPD